MKYRLWSLLFTFGLSALTAWALWEASHWPLQASLMAWIVGVPTLVLLCIELIREFLGRDTAVRAGDSSAPPTGAVPETAPFDTLGAPHRTAAIIGWILAFALAIWLLGFQTGITLLTFLYLRYTGGEHWGVSVALSAAIWLATTFFFDCTMHIFFAEGKLFTWLGVSSGQFYTGACQLFSRIVR